MNLTARTSGAALIGLTFFLGAPGQAQAQTQGDECIPTNTNKCTPLNPLPGCNPSGQQPRKCALPGPDGELGTEDDVVVEAGTTIAAVANTGFGGSAGTGSETTILLVGGGVLALGAAFGVRRARGTKA